MMRLSNELPRAGRDAGGCPDRAREAGRVGLCLLVGAAWIAALCAACLRDATGQEPQGPSRGALAGSTGGNERDCVAFARGRGAVAFVVTYGKGEFRFDGLDPGEYMVLSRGRIASRIPVRAGRVTTLDFADEPYYAPPAETWSPARRSFGQTFLARASQVEAISFWIPAGKHRLSVTFRRGGPNGSVVGGTRVLDGPVSWVVTQRFREGEVPTTAGERYYVEIRSLDGKTWQVGMPGEGDVYPDGEAYFDGVRMLDSDLALTIESDVSGLVRTAAADTGLGFIRKGPGSGFCRSAGQTFVATTRNVVAAYANAGWGGKPSNKLDFEFAIHDGGSSGSRVAGPVRVPMICNWGTTAVWFPDEVPVVPGKKYYLSMRRCDGEPFFAYLCRDEYAEGCAWRDGKKMPGFDLTFSIRGERRPGSLTYPFNVRCTASGTGLSMRWETGIPSLSRLRVAPRGAAGRSVAVADEPARLHVAAVPGLLPGTLYEAVAVCLPRGPAGFHVRSQPLDVRTEGSAPRRTIDEIDPLPRRPLALKNPGFEAAAAGWSVDGALGGAIGDAGGVAPPRGKGMFGYCHIAAEDGAGRPGNDVPRKIEPPERTVILQENQSS